MEQNKKIAQLLETVTMEKEPRSDAGKKRKVHLSKSNLESVRNSYKRVGVLSNYCQILLPLCTTRVLEKQLGRIKFSQEVFDQNKRLIQELKDHTNDFEELKPRDLCDVAHAVCNLR